MKNEELFDLKSQFRDERMKVINEVLNGIKVNSSFLKIKMNLYYI